MCNRVFFKCMMAIFFFVGMISLAKYEKTYADEGWDFDTVKAEAELMELGVITGEVHTGTPVYYTFIAPKTEKYYFEAKFINPYCYVKFLDEYGEMMNDSGKYMSLEKNNYSVLSGDMILEEDKQYWIVIDPGNFGSTFYFNLYQREHSDGFLNATNIELGNTETIDLIDGEEVWYTFYTLEGEKQYEIFSGENSHVGIILYDKFEDIALETINGYIITEPEFECFLKENTQYWICFRAYEDCTCEIKIQPRDPQKDVGIDFSAPEYIDINSVIKGSKPVYWYSFVTSGNAIKYQFDFCFDYEFEYERGHVVVYDGNKHIIEDASLYKDKVNFSLELDDNTQYWVKIGKYSPAKEMPYEFTIKAIMPAEEKNSDILIEEYYKCYKEKMMEAMENYSDFDDGEYYIHDFDSDGIPECIFVLNSKIKGKGLAYAYAWDGAKAVTTKIEPYTNKMYAKNKYFVGCYTQEKNGIEKTKTFYYKYNKKNHSFKKVGSATVSDVQGSYKIKNKTVSGKRFSKWRRKNGIEEVPSMNGNYIIVGDIIDFEEDTQ